MRRKRVLTIDGEDIELDPLTARKVVEKLVLLSHGNAAARASYEVLVQLISTDQLTACERHLVSSLGVPSRPTAGS